MKKYTDDDIEPEDVVSEDEESTKTSFGGSSDASDEAEASRKIAKMREELKVCRAEKQEYMDGWQRAKADYVNMLKRFEGDNATARQTGIIRAVEELLPAFDALERAKEHGDLPEGFIAIVKRLESGFVALGLESLGKEGEVFDPALHEALGQDPVTEEKKDDSITSVLEKGWKIGDTIIRPAKVRVGHFKL